MNAVVESYVDGMNDLDKALATGNYLNISKHVPNLLLAGYEKQSSGLWVKPSLDFNIAPTYDSFVKALYYLPDEPKMSEEVPFEVNLTEALVGWRGWRISKNGYLESLNNGYKWTPDTMFKAKCKRCKELPAEHHTCGIYAADSVDSVPSHTVLGEVYGWGRYVRGNSGWRCEFAYPKALYLKSNQADLIDKLRAYHVPIYIDQPLKIYDPSEDGYGHREDQENGYLGADQQPDAS